LNIPKNVTYTIDQVLDIITSKDSKQEKINLYANTKYTIESNPTTPEAQALLNQIKYASFGYFGLAIISASSGIASTISIGIENIVISAFNMAICLTFPFSIAAPRFFEVSTPLLKTVLTTLPSFAISYFSFSDGMEKYYEYSRNGNKYQELKKDLLTKYLTNQGLRDCILNSEGNEYTSTELVNLLNMPKPKLTNINQEYEANFFSDLILHFINHEFKDIDPITLYSLSEVNNEHIIAVLIDNYSSNSINLTTQIAY